MSVRDFSVCEPREGVERLGALLSRSLLLRGEPPADALWALLGALNEGDALLCCRRYHDMTNALLACPARRVSGELWQDFLLHLLLHTPHAFARAAAAGRRDDALYAAMTEELSVLGELKTLSCRDLGRMIESRRQELKYKPRQARDEIELFSTAVWSGGATRALPTPEEQKSATAFTGELRYAAWQYGEGGLTDGYVADEALEELYARLLESRDWSRHTEDLRCFFGAYGYGALLRERAFGWQNGLAPLPREVIAALAEPVYFSTEHERLLDSVIRFMQGEPPRHTLLIGPAGMGKTAQVFSMLHELPEVRLISAAPTDDMPALCRAMGETPLKFILLFDGVPPERLPSLLPQLLPGNALVCVTAREGALEWAERLEFLPLSGTAFAQYVCNVLLAAEVPFDYGAVRDACVDYQVDARDALSVAAALRIAGRFIAESGA